VGHIVSGHGLLARDLADTSHAGGSDEKEAKL
jgi:hypothetical protein